MYRLIYAKAYNQDPEFYDFVRSPVVPLANQRNAVAGICKTLHGITTWLQYVYDQRASDYEDAYEKEMYEDHPYFCDDTNPPDYSYEACPPDTEIETLETTGECWNALCMGKCSVCEDYIHLRSKTDAKCND